MFLNNTSECKIHCDDCWKRFFCQTYYCVEKCNGVYCDQCPIGPIDCIKKFKLRRHSMNFISRCESDFC